MGKAFNEKWDLVHTERRRQERFRRVGYEFLSNLTALPVDHFPANEGRSESYTNDSLETLEEELQRTIQCCQSMIEVLRSKPKLDRWPYGSDPTLPPSGPDLKLVS